VSEGTSTFLVLSRPSVHYIVQCKRLLASRIRSGNLCGILSTISRERVLGIHLREIEYGLSGVASGLMHSEAVFAVMVSLNNQVWLLFI